MLFPQSRIFIWLKYSSWQILMVESFYRTVWLYFIAVASHKYVLAFCIAMQLVTSGVRPCIRYVI
jgi:hypothetical protein